MRMTAALCLLCHLVEREGNTAPRSLIVPLNRLADTGQPIEPPPDVQRTTMSLDVLGRFVCNTWDEAIHNGGASFDAVIVGGGMFGGYCADKIARASGDHPLRVLVLEAGPFLVPTHVQNLPRTGLDVPDPIFPSADNGIPRDLVGASPGAATCSSSARPTASAASRSIGAVGARGFRPTT
jgi:hypothetical protein